LFPPPSDGGIDGAVDAAADLAVPGDLATAGDLPAAGDLATGADLRGAGDLLATGADLRGAGDLADPLIDGGGCGGLDSNPACTGPGIGSCADLVYCFELCDLDNNPTQCRNTQCSTPKSSNSLPWANAYLTCMKAASSSTGVCAAPCNPIGDACQECIHICSYNASCNYVCTCGACAAELQRCFTDL
jgi:hypothetical protein